MRTWGLGVLLLTMTAHAGEPTEPDDLPAPQPEIARDEPKVALPPVPVLELPVIEPGFHRPRELRVRGAALLGTEIAVKGYVTSIDGCAAPAPEAPQATRVELVPAEDEDRKLCSRPRFALSETPGASRDASITVADVPPATATRDAHSKLGLAIRGGPRMAIGDHVVVTGIWTTASPHGERDTRGLLIYRRLEHAVPAAATARPAASSAPAPAPANAAEITLVTRPPLRKVIDVSTFNASVDHLNACSRQIRAGRYDAGLAECEVATRIWDGNHLAWYAAVSAHVAKREWPEALVAAARAVALRPDQGMYQLYYGMSLYEATTDRSARTLGTARDALWRATRLIPALWRAHYYLGQVYRDLDDDRHAAEEFTQAIAMHPSHRAAYIALAELYRRWGYLDQALAVAMLGTAQVPAADAAELWYEVGMVHDARRADGPAIEAFTRALAARPGDTRSKFQRGQSYVRKRDSARARRDLEDVVNAADAPSALVPIAIQLLKQLSR